MSQFLQNSIRGPLYNQHNYSQPPQPHAPYPPHPHPSFKTKFPFPTPAHDEAPLCPPRALSQRSNRSPEPSQRHLQPQKPKRVHNQLKVMGADEIPHVFYYQPIMVPGQPLNLQIWTRYPKYKYATYQLAILFQEESQHSSGVTLPLEQFIEQIGKRFQAGVESPFPPLALVPALACTYQLSLVESIRKEFPPEEKSPVIPQKVMAERIARVRTPILPYTPPFDNEVQAENQHLNNLPNREDKIDPKRIAGERQAGTGVVLPLFLSEIPACDLISRKLGLVWCEKSQRTARVAYQLFQKDGITQLEIAAQTRGKNTVDSVIYEATATESYSPVPVSPWRTDSFDCQKIVESVVKQYLFKNSKFSGRHCASSTGDEIRYSFQQPGVPSGKERRRLKRMNNQR